MADILPIQFLRAIFPRPIKPHEIMVCSEIRRSGRTLTGALRPR